MNPLALYLLGAIAQYERWDYEGTAASLFEAEDYALSLAMAMWDGYSLDSADTTQILSAYWSAWEAGLPLEETWIPDVIGELFAPVRSAA